MSDQTSSQATPVVVSLASFKEILERIFRHISDDLGIEFVTIKPDRDFYWDMSEEELFDVRKERPTLNVGRLSDDWYFLSRLKDNPDEAFSLMLIHAAPLLRYIGEQVKK